MKIVINSEDRLNRTTTTSTDFKVQLPRSFIFKKVSLASVQLPNTVYNITSRNNTLPFNGSTNIVLVNGYYDINSLITTLNTALVSLGITVSLNTITNKVVFSSGGTFSMDLSGNNTPWRELGFLQQNYSGSTSYTAINCPSLERPICFQIQIPEIGLYSYHTNNNCYYTFSFNSNVSFGSLIDWYSLNTYEQTFEKVDCWNISTISVRLLADGNTSLDLNGAEWQFTLEIC